MVIEQLPKNLVVRPARLDDIKAVSEVIAACDIAEVGAVMVTEDDVRTDWQAPDFKLETDSWVVSTVEGRIVAFADVEHRQHARIMAFGRVHPEFNGLGLGTYLLHLAEERALKHIPEAQPEVRVALMAWSNSVNQEARHLLANEGLRLVRRTWHMFIELETPPTEPEWPEGIVVRPFVPGQDNRVVYEAVEEAFQDHWGHIRHEFKQWEYWIWNRAGFDPTLWFLAWDGDELAGAALCTYEVPTQTAWVDTLGVRRPWRRKGLGMALLKHSFGEFYRRGQKKVKLGVDSQNLTGATRLYERAGMHIAEQLDRYEKELRAGRELSIQTIAD